MPHFRPGGKCVKAYQLKITLKNSKPPIWRRCIVPAGITFSGLAEIFTEVMGWSGCRLSEFEFYYDKLKIMDNCDEFKYNNPYYGCMEASETIINELLESNDWFSYIYDSEGRWQHRVTIEKIIDDYEYDYPQIVKYKGNCPPEDCGGIYKYYELMDALNDEKHPEHDEYAKWAAANGYPNQYDMDAVNVLLKAEKNLKLIQADNCVGKAADRSDLIIMCFNAAEILYGIVPSRVIVEMYNNCCDCEEQYIDSKILKQELRRIPKEYINFEYVENQYVSVELLEDDSYNELLRYQRNKEFYIPGLSEIEQLYEYEYIADEPMLKRLQMFLVNKLGIEAAKAEACSGYAQRMVCDGYDMQEVLDFFCGE